MTRAQVLSARLEQLPAFADLSGDCRQALAEAAVQRSIDPGARIVTEGQNSACLYIVLQGRVKMSRQTPTGGRALLALFGPGDLFGAVAALNGEHSDATMTAVERCECLEVPRQDLMEIFRLRPHYISELLPVLSRQLVECRNCLVEAISSRVEVRFAHLFLKLGEKIGRSVPPDTLVPVSLSRQDLADMTGTSLESCIRIMSRWGKEDVVETRSDGFLIRDREALERLSHA